MNDKVAKAVNDLQIVKEKYGNGTERKYEPVQIPADFVQQLINRTNLYMMGLIKG